MNPELSDERIAEVYAYAHIEAEAERSAFPGTTGRQWRTARTTIALIDERAETRKLLSDLIETSERFDVGAMYSVASRARAILSKGDS